ncbi:MAG: response regulator [Bacteroidota bacterium]
MSKLYRILLVEDLPSDAYFVQRELKKNLGAFEFMVADNKEDFLNCLNSFHPDIILSDYSLPGFDWSLALKITRAQSPETPFLIVSSSTNPVIVNACLNAGITGFISKDNLNQLTPAIRQALEKTSELPRP